MITGRTRGFKELRQRILASPQAVRPKLEDAVSTEARLFVSAAVKITPPASPGVSGNKAKRQGEARVESDIRKVYMGAGVIFGLIRRRNPDAAKAFWAMVKGNPTSRTKTGKQRYSKKGVDLEGARRLMATYLPQYASVGIQPFDDGALHRKMRDPRSGRVKTRQPGMILSSARGFAGYIRKKQKNVGLLAAGFNGAAARLGASVPAWVQRHRSTGNAIDVRKTRTDFTIVIRNTAPWAQAQQMQNRMSYVARYRQNALQRKLAVILRLQESAIVGGR